VSRTALWLKSSVSSTPPSRLRDYKEPRPGRRPAAPGATAGELTSQMRGTRRRVLLVAGSPLARDDAERVEVLAARLLASEVPEMTVSELARGLGLSWSHTIRLLRHDILRTKYGVRGVVTPEGLSGFFRFERVTK